MCPVYLETLIQMNRTQYFRMNWSGYISSDFAAINGVKELLLATYLDDLLKELRNIDATLIFTGVFIYADGITIIGPS